MKKYFLLTLFLPLFGLAQECTTVIPTNNNADSIVYCVTNTTCYDTCNGVISITVYGDSHPYSFEWFNNSTPWPGVSIQDTLCPSDYIITITDVNGNLVDNSHVNAIEGPPNFSVFANALNNPTCFNYNDGSIDLTINGATPFDPDSVANSGDEFYTYLWEEGTSTEDRTLLDSGIYILSITDANGCNRVDSFELFNPDEVHSITITDTLSCIGICDGEAIVTPSDGVAPYNYQWSNGDTDSTATGLCYGLDTVYISDSNGCLDTNEVFIENPDTLKLSNITIDSACYQICDGQLSVTIVGGKSPYDTEWSLGGNIFNTNDTITEDTLCLGNYQLIYTDANNCSDTVSIPLIERDSFVVQDWIIDDSCYNSCTGQITIQLLNQEKPPFIYSWNNGGNDTIISNICSDTFELVIIDDRLCRDTFEFFVEPGDSMYFDSIAVTHSSCYGDEDGAISLINFNGGVQPLDYLWSDSQTTSGINSLSSGFYNVTVTDAHGCNLDSSNIQVTQPDSLFSSPSSLENVSCFGASDGVIEIHIFPIGSAYFISWHTVISDTNYIDSLFAGEYIYTIVDSNASTCPPIVDTIIIQEPDELIIQGSLAHVLCKGDNTGEIHLTINGGIAPYEYSIDGGVIYQSQSQFNNLLAGSYSIMVKDANDCLLSSPLYNITEPLTVLNAGLSLPNLLCFEDTGTILLTVNGGTPNYSFLWNNGAVTQNLNGIDAGNYSVTILDANHCELIENINISAPNEITVLVNTITDLLCFEDGTGSIDITINGGIPVYSVLWNNGSITSDINNLSAGTYEITVTDNNACQYVESFIVEEPALLEVSYLETHVDCFGNSTGGINVTVSGGIPQYSFDWSNLTSNEDLQNIPIGTYDVTITDANNCIVYASVNINEPSDIIYSVTIIDLICNNIAEGEISIITTGGTPAYSYSINEGSTYQSSSSFIDLEANNYSVWIKDANGCEKHLTYSIDQPNGYSNTYNIQNIEDCNGDATGAIDIIPSGGTPNSTSPFYAYSWTGPGSFSASTQDISGLLGGSYTVAVTDANNCEMSYSYQITEPEALELEYTVFSASCDEKNDGSITTFVKGGTAPIYYEWSNGSTSSDIFDLPRGPYSLYIYDEEGCSIPIEYFEVGFDSFNGCIEIPSGFTPNGDTYHDEWVIYGLNDFPDVVVKVYNRWGQEIFSSLGYLKPWDGKYNGVDLPTAAYYYVIELNESDKVFNGIITIKR